MFYSKTIHFYRTKPYGEGGMVAILWFSHHISKLTVLCFLMSFF